MADIKDVAVACWRLEKWLANADVEKKMAAKSSLRTISNYLKENGVEIQDITGWHFDSGLNVDVINNESQGAPDEELVIKEMVKPIVLQHGAVIARGSVILSATAAFNPDTEAAAQVVEPAESTPHGKETVDGAEDVSNPNESEARNSHFKEFASNSLATIRRAGATLVNKETWKSIWSFCRTHATLILQVLALLLLIIGIFKISGVEHNLQNPIVPSTDQRQGVIEGQQSQLPDGVTITEDGERNIYIHITSK